MEANETDKSYKDMLDEELVFEWRNLKMSKDDPENQCRAFSINKSMSEIEDILIEKGLISPTVEMAARLHEVYCEELTSDRAKVAYKASIDRLPVELDLAEGRMPERNDDDSEPQH